MAPKFLVPKGLNFSLPLSIISLLNQLLKHIYISILAFFPSLSIPSQLTFLKKLWTTAEPTSSSTFHSSFSSMVLVLTITLKCLLLKLQIISKLTNLLLTFHVLPYLVSLALLNIPSSRFLTRTLYLFPSTFLTTSWSPL